MTFTLLPDCADSISVKSYSGIYGYGNGPTEPVLHVILPGTDWVVRNRYDAQVWISKTTPILDIDDKSDGVINQVIETCELQDVHFRLYETAKGLRLILPDGLQAGFLGKANPFHLQTLESLMDSLPVDPQYKELCFKQKCFRARLSTKPWRTDGNSLCHLPIGQFGHLLSPSEALFAKDFGVTRLIAAVDTIENHVFSTPIGFHDFLTAASNKTLPLA